jgi:hypothetical protein
MPLQSFFASTPHAHSILHEILIPLTATGIHRSMGIEITCTASLPSDVLGKAAIRYAVL